MENIPPTMGYTKPSNNTPLDYFDNDENENHYKIQIQTMTVTVIVTPIAKTCHQNQIKVRGMDHHQMPGLMRLTPQTNHLMLM